MTAKVLIIRTDFKHHGEHAGYKQILKYFKPYKILGVNERDPDQKLSFWKRRYFWFFEWEARKYQNKVDLVHLMYGEDYLRFSPWFVTKVPIVATFHQPADLLEREALYGDPKGRLARMTHLLTKKRFQKLAAAIVTNPSQKRALEKVMPSEKIHIIPLGVHLDEVNAHFDAVPLTEQGRSHPPAVITVGAWLRDWDFYFQVVAANPQWQFWLVSRNLKPEILDQVHQYPNLVYHENVGDKELFDLYLQARLQFLPVTGMAGSNALLQGMALGCPLVLTDIHSEPFQGREDIIRLHQPGDVPHCSQCMRELIETPADEAAERRKKAHLYASEFTWESVARKTIALYESLI